MQKHLDRILLNSPIKQTQGKLLLAAILVTLFLLFLPGFKEYYTVYPLQLTVGMLMATVAYCPTLLVLRYLDRREREPWQLALLTVLAVVLFFCPVTSHALGLIDKLIPSKFVVGFIEEFWKITPLLLLVFFVPRAVGGTRDGLIYGALGGFGFAILEFAANSTWEGYTEKGWGAFVDGVARFNLLGTNNHIIWSATIGAGIGWAVTHHKSLKRWVAPIAVYLAVAVLHILEDNGGNIATTMLTGSLIEPLVEAQSNPEAFMNRFFIPIQLFFGTMNTLLINIILLPILFVVLRRSGNTERQVIREQLSGEEEEVITRSEYAGVVADRRFRMRRIDGLPKAASRQIVQWQNELAFHKAFVLRTGGSPDSDAAIIALRERIKTGRAGLAHSAMVP